jgi:excisionase family DNA binding protein
MSAKTTIDEVMGVGEAARRLGVDTWELRRLYEKGQLPDPPRIGRHRLIRGSELPRLRDLLREAGKIKDGDPDRPSAA